VKHATPAALGQIDGLLESIRTKPGLKEKSLGVFYRKSKPFLHFHEDRKGMFADLMNADGFDRYAVNSPAEWEALLFAIDQTLRG
jgi:hypothetical protein